MTAYAAALVLLVAADAWVAGYAVLFARRRRPRVLLAAILAAFAGVGALAAVGEGAPGSPLGLAVLLLGYAAVPLFVVLYPVDASVRRRWFAILALAAPAPGIAALGAAMGWGPGDAFLPATDLGHLLLNSYLVACLAVALAESLGLRFRSPALRGEAGLLALGSLVLLATGPFYRFEVAFLGLPDLQGANWAAPLAGIFFAAALRRGDALPFRGRPPSARLRIPWMMAPGIVLLQESWPKYARAAFLAAVRTGRGLALVAGPGPRARELAGLECVRLPPGDRCASVLASTAEEFLGRFPQGAVLVEDLSYAVVHSGPRAAAEALNRLARVVPQSARVLVSLSKLTARELEVFRSLPVAWIVAPEFEAELEGILERRLGGGKALLARVAASRRTRIEGLSFADLPHVLDHTMEALAGLRATGDDAALPGWPRVAAKLGADLEILWRTPPSSVRPAQAATVPPEDFPLVWAEDVLSRGRAGTADAPPLGAALREALVGCLGPAGDPVYRRVLKGLRKEPALIRPDDLPTVARLVDAALADLAGALDTDSARHEIVTRGLRLQTVLQGLAGEGR